MINLDLTLVGWVHTAACVVAMVAFVPIMLSRKGGARHRAAGRVYAVAYLVVCITALRELAGPRILASPVVGMTHGVVMIVFVALIVGYVTISMSSRTRRARVASVTP